MSESKKILVGEDSSIIINLTKNVLAFENYQMKAARNGKQVLEFLEKEPFDLILMDISMPVMDGVECTRLIRSHSNPAVSKLPIIAISGNIHNYTPEEFRRLGFDDFIQKPLDYDKVLATVKKILS
ncbi:Response regulator receiver domain-containing protein [Algoriphagus alkaliphilus]|uniref:Response regulator receiver domain-containing protein n=1 Tax=Algoriphagus alkaliphilus TaxID=279824 RepID=A0A1G5X6M6_9BACT|nr:MULTISPECIES: response regulator [Algoriphagus]MBA4299641.1 response regulator [Cyclobacterium sp.]MDP2039916.1 response regulator [Algoriphagus sp.]MDP3471660.1 response regulator [Algoriphagus sp.]SDA66088.1 Response regulator receiver domain-containing protein [Algoriphagus alkaliphilus]